MKNKISRQKSLIGKAPVLNLATRQRENEIIAIAGRTKFACEASYLTG